MRIPEQVARFNRHVTNPVQRLWADKLPGMAIVEHIGRRSGKAYRTPVNIFREQDGFAIVLFYGPDRDWVRNLSASGGGRVVYRGHRLDVAEPTVLPARDVVDTLPKQAAELVRRLGVEYVLRVKRSPRPR